VRQKHTRGNPPFGLPPGHVMFLQIAFVKTVMCLCLLFNGLKDAGYPVRIQSGHTFLP